METQNFQTRISRLSCKEKDDFVIGCWIFSPEKGMILLRNFGLRMDNVFRFLFLRKKREKYKAESWGVGAEA